MADVVLFSRVLDNGLKVLDDEATHIYICSQAPTTYTEATSTYALGNKNFGAGAVFNSPAAGSPNGRQVTSNAVTNGSVTANGTPARWAITDNANSRLLAEGAFTGAVAITSGQVWSLSAMAIQLPQTAGGDFTTGLQAHWPMDDAHIIGGGTLIEDIVSTWDAGINGGITSAAGPNATYATARAFDGAAGTYAQFATGDTGPVDWATEPCTLAVWIYAANVANTTWVASFSRVLNSSMVAFGAAGDGTLFSVNTATNRTDTTGSWITSNDTWYHIGVTWSAGGGGTCHFYVNGSDKATSTQAGFGPGSSKQDIGVFQSPNSGNLAGRMAGLRVYNRALTASDMAALYAAGG